MFVPIEIRNSILKLVTSEDFFMKPMHQFIYPDKKNEFMVPNHEKKRDYYVNMHLSQLIDQLQF